MGKLSHFLLDLPNFWKAYDWNWLELRPNHVEMINSSQKICMKRFCWTLFIIDHWHIIMGLYDTFCFVLRFSCILWNVMKIFLNKFVFFFCEFLMGNITLKKNDSDWVLTWIEKTSGVAHLWYILQCINVHQSLLYLVEC